jgi:lysozyme family protein
MAKSSIAFKIISKNEGGYTIRRNDSGNWSSGKIGVGILIGTNRGISAIMLAVYLKRKLVEADKEVMKNLSFAIAEKIKEDFFWKPILGDLIANQEIANLLADSFFWKPRNTLEWVRNILGTRGNILRLSVKEVETINAMNASVFYNLLKKERLKYIKNGNNPSNRDGWVNRTNRFNDFPENATLTRPSAPENKINVGAIAAVLVIGFLIVKS